MTGSHNSFSYLPVRQWWLKPFAFAARCQSADIEAQLRKGVECVDARIRFDADGSPKFAHGAITYSCDYDALAMLKRLVDTQESLKGIRLILEDDGTAACEANFKKFCDAIVMHAAYAGKKIRFFGGNRRSDWKRVVKFERKAVEAFQPVGSMSGSLIGKAWPWLWKFLHPKKARKSPGGDCQLALYDFV